MTDTDTSTSSGSLDGDDLNDLKDEVEYYLEELKMGVLKKFDETVLKKSGQSHKKEDHELHIEELNIILKEGSENLENLKSIVKKLDYGQEDCEEQVKKIDQELRLRSKTIEDLEYINFKKNQEKQLQKQIKKLQYLSYGEERDENLIEELLSEQIPDMCKTSTSDRNDSIQNRIQRKKIEDQMLITQREKQKEEEEKTKYLREVLEETAENRELIDSILDKLIVKSERITMMSEKCMHITHQQNMIMGEIDRQLEEINSDTKRLNQEVRKFFRVAFGTKLFLVLFCVVFFVLAVVVIVAVFAIPEILKNSAETESSSTAT